MSAVFSDLGIESNHSFGRISLFTTNTGALRPVASPQFVPSRAAGSALTRLARLGRIDVTVVADEPAALLDSALDPRTISLFGLGGLEQRVGKTITPVPGLVAERWALRLSNFTTRVTAELGKIGVEVVSSPGQAGRKDAVWLTKSDYSVSLFDGPARDAVVARSSDGASKAAFALQENLEKFAEIYRLFPVRSMDNFSVRATARDEDNELIDKARVVRSLDLDDRDALVYVAADTSDYMAAIAVKARGGKVVVVDTEPTDVHEGTPQPLLDLADLTIAGHDGYVAFLTDMGNELQFAQRGHERSSGLGRVMGFLPGLRP